jgi:NAD(P)-dependent dehydrogenase (short-subunit alcohol dehydrogenase family)
MSGTALVTGAAGGIGAAVARRLAADGLHCVLVDRDPAVREVAAEIGGTALTGDLADPSLTDRAVAAAGPGLAAVALNAGVNCPDKDPADLDPARYAAVVGVNQHAVVHGLRAALPVLRARGGGAIVVTGSLASLRPTPQDPFYAMTKHAVIGLVRSLAPALGRENIRLTAVCPGLVDTPLTAGARDRMREAGIAMLTAEEVATAAVGLLDKGEPGTELVVLPGRAPAPYISAPLP